MNIKTNYAQHRSYSTEILAHASDGCHVYDWILKLALNLRQSLGKYKNEFTEWLVCTHNNILQPTVVKRYKPHLLSSSPTYSPPSLQTDSLAKGGEKHQD